MSQECTLRLDKSGLFFEVEFPALIPSKKPYYVSVVEQDTAAKSQGVIQLCYEYTKMGQVHSLQQFPSRWTVPLELAWNYYWAEREDTAVISPTFNECEHTYACKDEVRMDLPAGSRNVSDTRKAGKLGTWLNDDISPASDLLKHSEPLLLVWDKKAAYRRVGRSDVETLVFKDKSLVLAKDGGAFFCHLARNSGDEELSCVRRFTQSSVPFKIRNPLTGA
eukprot:TRINITY_DN12386_c0_g1_i1.p1 TRINITY_DN12386_c0_g1~~TRINITY_DN12386_c0_g1_i1.p1  ORF type:complete len:221 (+),score=44.13 TRINITY_DN12386_c0_g1_i1:544-1206(+)